MDDAQEPILEPDLEIVDAHHHVWTDHEPPYPWARFQSDVVDSGHRVTGSIFVECGWGWDEPGAPGGVGLPEVRAAVALAEQDVERGPALLGVVGFVDLRLGDVAAQHLAQAVDAGRGYLVGVRHATAWHQSAGIAPHRTVPAPGLLRDAGFRRGLRAVADAGLPFDAWLYHSQLDELADVAKQLPDLRIVVDHLGGPLSCGPYRGAVERVDDEWRRGIKALARFPQVILKLSGIGMDTMALSAGGAAASHQLAERWAPRLLWAVEQFGAERCMFASNFRWTR